MKKVEEEIREARKRVSINHGIIERDVSWEDIAYELAYTNVQNTSKVNGVENSDNPSINYEPLLGVVDSKIYATTDESDGEIFCAFDNKERAELEQKECGCGLQTIKLYHGKRQ